MKEFKALDVELALAAILEKLAKMPTLKRAYGEASRERSKRSIPV